MKKDKTPSTEAADLRRRAEAKLRDDAAKGAPGERTEADLQRLVHELQVHQIELEMQNEELRRSWAEVEAWLERYTELYDFAPVGYLTLGRDGVIRLVNLAGTHLLGMEGTRLSGRRFGVFVAEPNRAAFTLFLEKVFASRAQEVCEVALRREDNQPLVVHLTGTAAPDGQECSVVLADITARRQAEAQAKYLATFPMLNPRPIVEVDVAGQVQFCNPVAEQIFPDLHARGAGHPWLSEFEALLRTLREADRKTIVREMHFDEKWYHQTIHFVDDGRRLRIYGADITARKKTEAALQEAFAAVEALVVERTAELVKVNMELKREVETRKKAEMALSNKAMALKDQAVRLKEANAALKVLLQQRDADKIELEDKVLLNINQLILPVFGQIEAAEIGCQTKSVCRDPGVQPERDRLATRAQPVIQNAAAFADRA